MIELSEGDAFEAWILETTAGDPYGHMALDRNVGGDYAVDRTRGRWEGWQAGRAALEAERDALAKDAARYRWIRAMEMAPFCETDQAWDSGEALDAAIDQAMEKAD